MNPCIDPAHNAEYDIAFPGTELKSTNGVYTSPRDYASKGCGRLMKILLHADCNFDCAYCGICRRKERKSISPVEMARYFLDLNERGIVQGLFLSSGIAKNVDVIMEELIETASIIRGSGFHGYLHLKVIPGASRTDIREMARLASRISINIEAPSASRLSEIAGVKDYRQDIIKRQEWVAEEAPGRHTTQIVVGAAGESDHEILSCVDEQYRRTKPARIYYSPFRPIEGTPLSGCDPAPQWRTNRWYQLDFLMRKYGYSSDDFREIMDDDDMLLNIDPKRLIADTMPAVNVNTASYEELIRVPGIGPAGARKITNLRNGSPIRSSEKLSACGVRIRDALPFIEFGDGSIQSRLIGYDITS